MLVFPEVLDKDRHELLHEMIVPIEKFFEEQGKVLSHLPSTLSYKDQFPRLNSHFTILSYFPTCVFWLVCVG